MRRTLFAVVSLLLVSTPSVAQQWDQVNGSMQVRSGPSAPLVIIDQTASGQKIISLRANGTEVCYATATAFTCTGGFTFPASCTGTYTGPFTNGVTSTGSCVNGTAVITTTATTFTSTVPLISGASPAAAGQIRLPNNTTISWRDAAGTGDVQGIAVNASDVVTLAGGGLVVSGALITVGADIALTSKLIDTSAPSVPVACTSPTVTWSNGTATFQIDVGTTCAGISTLVVTMPAASNAWMCDAMNVTTSATGRMEMTASTTTSATFTSYTRTTGLALVFVDGTDVRIKCSGG